MAHESPGGGHAPRARDDDPAGPEPAHRPMGLELDALGTGDQVAAEEQERHAHLPGALRLLDTVVNVVMVVLLVVLVVSVAANVGGRFTGWWSLPAAGEIARFLFIWVIFLGAALAHVHSEHISVSLFVERLPHGMQRAAVVLQELVILVVVVALLLSARQVMAISPGSSPLLDVPLQLVNFAVPFCAALMGLITVYRIVLALRPSTPGKG